MPRQSGDTRRRIVEAAYYLFYRRGFARVGVDKIAARARITKRTLYTHFRSKDDLLAAALHGQGDFDLARLQVIAQHFPPATGPMLDSFFGQLAKWAGTPGWSGSGFTRVVVELADLPGHPARAIARRAKNVTESWLTDLLASRRVVLPGQRAKEIMVLMEGAMILMLMHGDRSYADVAARAARRLVGPARTSGTRRKSPARP